MGTSVKASNRSSGSLAERIRTARRGVNATQQALAEAVGVSRPAISQWEGGETKDIKPENLLRACRFLGVRPEWLVFGQEPIRPAGTPGARVDPRALGSILDAMEHVLAEERLALTASKKAELVAVLYEMFTGTGELPDQSTVSRLARLAA